MKTFRTLLSALCLAASMPLMAQNVNHVHDVSTIDRHAMHAYREGEVIVKFKPTSRVNVSAARTGAVRSNVSSVDAVLAKIGVTGAEQLMPLSGTGGPARVKSYAGGYIERSDMSKLYRLQLDAENGVAVYEAVDALKELADVEYAEPNYLVYSTALPESETTKFEEEPLFKEQWAFNAINLKNVWTKKTITDKRPVIAILDTGVDTEHPDLAANIWTNEREANGAEGADDDANGFKDDLHGWDFVDQTARIGDWNGHGTHVAGIAAAVGNNGVGITGANPDALIMPITVMQSDGTGDVATIIKGIDYAAANGADVINMSFGGYGYSIAQEQALARAYNTAVLVAAAGNDCRPINPDNRCPVCREWGAPMFPAAFSIVFGVEAGNRDGSRASFSNYDDDGATFSAFSEEKLYNYELRAPGVAMTSTFPGGKYKALNGTSMASPLVAGAISRLLQCKEYSSKEVLFGDLIHASKKNSNGIVDFQAAYEIKDEDRKPTLQFVSYELVDTLADGTPTVNNPNIMPEIPDYRPKVSNDSVEYWYNINFHHTYQTVSVLYEYKLTALAEGLLTADVIDVATLGEEQQWKFTGNETEGFTITNKLGYTICAYLSSGSYPCFYVSKEPTGYTKFFIRQNGLLNKHNISFISTNGTTIYSMSRSTGDYYCIKQFYGSPSSSEYAVTFTPLFDIENEEKTPEDNTENIVEGSDGDGRPDAGEVLELWPMLRNEWGNAENITFSLEVSENEDPTIVEILDSNVSFGKPLSGYAKAKSENPLRIKINEKCNDRRNIRLVLRATCDNIAEELVYEFVITVENGDEIGGILTQDMTLYPDKHYVVTSTLSIPSGVTLTIKPGTVIEFCEKTGLTNDGKLVCKGTPDSLIVFTEAGNQGNGLKTFKIGKNENNLSTLEYVKMDGLKNPVYKYANFRNSIILDNLSYGNTAPSYSGCKFNKCNITNNSLPHATYYGGYVNTNVVENQLSVATHPNLSNSNEALDMGSNIFSNYLNDNVTPKNLQYTPGSVNVLSFIKPCYWGSANEETVRLGVYDAYHKTNPSGSGIVNLTNMLTRPSAEAHGVVWKVVVNGYDAQDEFEMLPPIGVGKHKFEVYFNRPMDVSVAPTVAMGVRPPYTQVTIAEDGEWSADSLVYTAYLTIDGKTGCDGLNRIYVAGARDNEYFDIPIEKRRFNVEVAAAGSMATGLMAEAGLGKVTLTWETDEEDFEDLLGYNIYRYTMNDGVSSDSIIVNESVLESDVVEFVDYDVVPGTTYYYVIKQLTTSLNSHALSNAVAATPLTAQKGDANGSMAVDIADVVTEVAWLTNQDPQPFIFEAADVNSDNNVNILDVVGTVTIITNPESVATASVNSTATYTIEDGILYIDSDVAVGGIQLSIAAPKGTQFEALEALNGFEQMNHWMNDDECMFLAFSMTGKSIAPGKQAILRIGDATLNEVVISNSRGANVMAVNGNATCVSEVVGEDVEEEGIYDLAGRKLKQISSPGVYIVNGKKTFVK